MSNYTWEIVEFPPKLKPIGCRCVFKKELKLENTIDKYKPRLVTKDYKQNNNIGYFNTYFLVTIIVSIKMLFVIASKYKLSVHPIDDKTAFLNGGLKYMKQPEGCIVSKQEHKVFKLGTSIYGLKQEPTKLII